MIESLFVSLSQMLTQKMPLALTASFLWGMLSVALSPCHIASVPLIVGFIDRQGISTPSRSAIVSSIYATGILFSLIIIGFITALLGRIAGDVGTVPEIIVGVVFIGVGLYLADIISLPFLDNSFISSRFSRKGLIPAFFLGLIFGISVGPCTFAYFAPVLGISFTAAGSNIIFAITLVAAYALGHCAIIILGGTFVSVLQKYLNWTEESKAVSIIKKTCGTIVALTGIYIIFNFFKIQMLTY